MKNKLRFFYVLPFVMIPLFSAAQLNTRGDRSESLVKAAVAPQKSKKVSTSKRKQAIFKKRKVKHSPEYEYYARVEKAAKDRKRMLKYLDKPQYYNPLYFGHKRPPKRNPPHKMKFCKECRIRH